MTQFLLLCSYCILLQIDFLFGGNENVKNVKKRTTPCDPEYLHLLETKVQTMLDQVKDISSKYTQQQNLINRLTTQANQVGSGGMYVRWGRTTCPGNATELVYAVTAYGVYISQLIRYARACSSYDDFVSRGRSLTAKLMTQGYTKDKLKIYGYAGGSLYTHTGAAAEYVCLPKIPQYEFNDYHDYDGYIYGAEYEANFFGAVNVADDVPCAVCRSTQGRSILMTPAKNTCESGWNMEYHGILASGYHSHAAASQYVCLDHQMEASPHGNRNEYGKLMYRVRGKCGSLPCPPYIDGRILSCVVCSR